MPKANRKFSGEWRFMEMSDMGDDYVELGQGKPILHLKAEYEDQIYGEYEYGLSNGMIGGAVRVFGGETIVIFGHDSMDEMDPANGGGWMRLRDDGKLEGEFVNGLGRFVARKKTAPRSKKVKPKRK